MPKHGIKIVAQNKKARHDYFLLEEYVCGIVLKGTEIKSIRNSNVSIKDSFITIKDNEAYINNMHISPFDKGNIHNHDPLRTRKLLLHKKEIIKIFNKIRLEGLTVVPTKVLLQDGYAKLEIFVAKGKKQYDKRQDIKERDAKRNIDRNMKNDY